MEKVSYVANILGSGVPGHSSKATHDFLLDQPFFPDSWRVLVQFCDDSDDCIFGLICEERDVPSGQRITYKSFAISLALLGDNNSELPLLGKSVMELSKEKMDKLYVQTRPLKLLKKVKVPLQAKNWRLEVDVRMESLEERGSCESSRPNMEILFQKRHPNNVRLYFPDTGKSLWVPAAILRQLSSSYFGTFFDSSFAESASSSSTFQPFVTVKKEKLDFAEENSDTTLDASGNGEVEVPAAGESYHQIVITDADYTTYKAVLLWFLTREIKFSSPDSSSLSLLSLSDADDATSPLLCPKSGYKLSHYLEIEELEEICLQAFLASLTIENVATELYSEVASLYPDICGKALDFAVENWAKVKETVAWKEVMEKLGQGELAFTAEIGAKLATRLSG